MCSILLLEATTASTANLGTAVTTASNTAHVLAISNSYGIAGDYPGSFAPAWDNAAKKGIAVMASTGDGGYGPEFPASATNVIGVGGTTLSVDATGARTTETAWAGAGSGCSVYNAAPAWQSIPGNPCAGKKAIADLSADADPNSGLAVYTTYSNVTGYWVFGGTSLSSPLVAALYTMQGGYNASNLAGQYAWAAGTPYYDVTSGSNGTCTKSVLCTAGVGWDGPTGRGSIATSTAPPVLTTITVSPASASVPTGGTQQFSATGKDQFGQPMSPQPTFSWSVSGGGSISCLRAGHRRNVSWRAVHGDRIERRREGHRERHRDGPAGPDHDHRLPGERFGPDRWDATVQRLGQGPVRPADEPAADVHLVGERRGLDQRRRPVQRRIDRRRAVHGDRIERRRDRHRERHGDERAPGLLALGQPDRAVGQARRHRDLHRDGHAGERLHGVRHAEPQRPAVGVYRDVHPQPGDRLVDADDQDRSTTSRQTYTLTIKGVSGSLSHSTNASLTVTR